MASRAYDLVVIGTGTAAGVASSRCRAAGWRVALVDHLPFGGTCALRGCDPKKVLVAAAEAVDLARRMRGKGVVFEEGAIDWPDLVAYKRTFTDPVPASMEEHLAKQGIDAYHGRARFTGARSVAVNDETLQARFILVAAGAVPAPLRIEGEELLATSAEFLDLEALPRRIAFIGGGYIAAEFSHVAARAGAEATVLQRHSRLLPAFDSDLVGWLTRRSEALGIRIHLDTAVTRIEKRGDGLVVHAHRGEAPLAIAADLAVHAAGRVPALDALDLGRAGVEVAKGRIVLNDHLQSVSNPAVYAAGDSASKGPALTPVAAHDGEVVATNLLEGNRAKPDYAAVPSVVFTIPPLASVGLTHRQAQEKGLKFRVSSASVPDWYTARRVAEPLYGYKVLVEEGSERILGASLVGPHADEAINLFALAIRNRLPASALRDVLFAYPTAVSDVPSML
jgi:glutathione reductase (NADPH)